MKVCGSSWVARGVEDSRGLAKEGEGCSQPPTALAAARQVHNGSS